MSDSKKTIRALLVAGSLALLAPVPAMADQMIGGYWAYIGRADLRNSRGQRLTSPAQVLRQDRANLHRYNIWQKGDEWDPYFGSYQAREAIAALVQNGSIGPRARAVLTQGRGLVYVHVYANRNGRLTRLRVTLNR